jgi:4-amino-4-deoxy-L-arabinose transferase-like glycosyltransferase
VTSFFDAVIAFLVAGVAVLFIVSRVRRAHPGPTGTFLGKVFLATYAIRCVGALFLNTYAGDSAFADAFWGDSGTYDIGAHVLTLSWSGDAYVSPTMGQGVSGFGFTYFVAALYWLFGRNQLLVQLVNALIGSGAVLIIHAIAVRLFDERAARRAALMMAFFPQMIFWSCAMYKDPSVLFCIALAMLSLLRLRDRFSPFSLLLLIGSALALLTLRFYIFYMVIFATVGTFLFAQRRGLLGNVFGQFVLVSAFVGALVLGVRRETIEQQTSYFDLDRLQTARQDQARLAKSGYGAEIDVSTPEGAISALPVGLAYLLFSPFPWAIRGLRQALTLPETLVWYALMPALVRGLLYTVREKLRDALPILVFAGTLIFAYAIFQSNVGTAYRQRTQVAMFFFVFMGVGLEARRPGRERRDPRPLAGARPAWQR